jgi:selenocysteine lyase/cysteine desulfurase
MGACAALDLIDGWGVDAIAATLARRTQDIADAVAPLGLCAAPLAQRGPHFLALRFAEAVPPSLLERLAAAHVFASVRGTSLRITPHLYNDDADVAALVAGLGG